MSYQFSDAKVLLFNQIPMNSKKRYDEYKTVKNKHIKIKKFLENEKTRGFLPCVFCEIKFIAFLIRLLFL
jgi:hypothetical protein